VTPFEPTPNRRPTMREVARSAGVSLKTVSRVVNDEPGVSPALQGRVHTAIAALGYEPDARARSLRRTGARDQTIGLILVDAGNPFAGLMTRGVEDVARKHGSLVIAASSDEDPERESLLFRELVARRVDGLVMYPTDHAAPSIVRGLERGTQVVCVDRVPDGLPCDAVVSDNRGGIREATELLLSTGHRDIGYLGDSLHIYTARERLAGFQEAMARAGISVDRDRTVAGLRDPEVAESAARAMLSGPRRPTGLIAAQNLVTIGTIKALHQLGLEHEVALISFDDVQFATELSPAITAVAQDPYELGRRATVRLFERLDGDTSEPHLDVLPVPLIRRGSGEMRVSR
jgi:LacI family transcriptional regulator